MHEEIEKIFGISDCRFSETTHRADEKTGTRYKVFHFVYDGPVPDRCPKCGGKVYKHGTRTIHLTDIPAEMPVKWDVTVPRIRCRECRSIWTPTIKGIDEQRSLTSRAFAAIAQRSLRDAFKYIGEDYLLSGNTVKNIFVDFLKFHESMLQFKTPAFIGIDEIKVKRLGELTVITDLEHRTLFDMLQGRNQKTLTEYFMNLRDRDKVLWVCSDMYRPFQKTIGDAMPNARWAIDHFHVVMKANEAVDAVRRQIQGDMSKKDRIKTKRGLAYTLKTRARDLEPGEAEAIRMCREDRKLHPLAVAFDLKEDFFHIYDDNMESRDNAEAAFAKWEKSIPKDELYSKFRELAATVHNFYEQIFNAWDCPIAISNGYTECTNRLIRENNTRGRGYSFDVLRGRTLYRKTNLQRVLDGNLALIGPDIPMDGPVFYFEGTDETEDNPDDLDFDPETGEVFE